MGWAAIGKAACSAARMGALGGVVGLEGVSNELDALWVLSIGANTLIAGLLEYLGVLC